MKLHIALAIIFTIIVIVFLLLALPGLAHAQEPLLPGETFKALHGGWAVHSPCEKEEFQGREFSYNTGNIIIVEPHPEMGITEACGFVRVVNQLGFPGWVPMDALQPDCPWWAFWCW